MTDLDLIINTVLFTTENPLCYNIFAYSFKKKIAIPIIFSTFANWNEQESLTNTIANET